MIGRLPETDARVDDQIAGRDPGPLGAPDRRTQVFDDFPHHVVVARFHAVVHYEQRHAGAGRELRHRRVGADTPDVVEQMGAGGQRRLGHDGLRRVDAERDAG